MIEMRVLDYRITSDDRQVIVNKARRNEHGELTILTDKDGTEKESLALIGYYGNLSKALVAIERDYVLSSGKTIQTVKEYKKELESIHSKLKRELDFGEEFQMNELVKLVEEWAKEKRLDKAEPEKQIGQMSIKQTQKEKILKDIQSTEPPFHLV